MNSHRRPASSIATSRAWGLVGYIALLAVGIGLFLLIRSAGERIGAADRPGQTNRAATSAAATESANAVLHVIATLAAVIALGHLLGRLGRFFGQPAVIGEVVAGILIGPSLLGAISPSAMHTLIPSPEMDPHGQVPAALNAISQLGIILYMFLVGLELNAGQLRGRMNTAIAVSQASIVVPFVFGTALALWLYPVLSPRDVSFTNFALFMGIAMSVTAFPVLARILTDHQLEKTPLGVLALACAAVGDVMAWCLLAFVVGVVQAQARGALVVAVGAGCFIAATLLVVRPLLTRVTRRLDALSGPLPAAAVSGMFVLVLLSSLLTELIGIHAVLGAFLLGAIVPHESRVTHEFTVKLKDPVTVLLLPAFFALTGMRTEIGLLHGWNNWCILGIIILVATVGKFGGTVAAARLTGLDWRDAAALGTLMNTRGLMELIVLSIGLDLGIISPTLFAMMVLMALVTTMVASPIVCWLLHINTSGP
jgi:Kef-type K+ transport system membrane component KefB